jgi:hypothetical protein
VRESVVRSFGPTPSGAVRFLDGMGPATVDKHMLRGALVQELIRSVVVVLRPAV